MFCPKCGHAVESGDKFCTSCGTPLREEAAPTPTPDPTPAPQPETDFSAQSPDFDFSVGQPEPRPSTKAASLASPFAIRNALTSPAALVALIALTTTMVLKLLGLFDIHYVTYDFMYGMDIDFYDIYAISIVFSLLSAAPSVLIVIGSWMTYASAIAGQSKTTGLTMVRVALIILLVLMCVILGLCEIVLLVAVSMFSFGSPQYYFSSYGSSMNTAAVMQGVFVFAFIAIAAALVLIIIYYVKAYKMTGVMRNTLATGIPSDRISGFVAVMQFILGGCTALSTLSALHDGGILTILGGICSATAAISFGVFLFGYRSKMRALMTGAQNGL